MILPTICVDLERSKVLFVFLKRTGSFLDMSGGESVVSSSAAILNDN